MEYKPIVLFAKFNFHLSCLGPISRELDALGVDHILTTKRYKIYDLFNESKKKFKLIVLADEWINLFREQAELIMTTNHSMANKNTTFNLRNNKADYICASSQWQKNEFLARGITARKGILITGYPAADNLFNNTMSGKTIWANYPGMNSFKKNILFAPTYNKDLNFMDELVKWYPGMFESLQQYNIAFKLHPVLPKKYPEHLKLLQSVDSNYSNVFLYLDSHSDISDALIWADLVVGDCSGVILLAAITGKPMILYDNPNKEQSPYYDETGPEWKFREEIGFETSTFRNLPSHIEGLLDLDVKRDTRKRIVNLLYGEQQDSDSAKRIAKYIQEITTK